jgi:hypothetical protein
MKKIIFLLLAAFTGLAVMKPVTVHAQEKYIATEAYNAEKHRTIKLDTTVNVDTSIVAFNSVASKLKGFDIYVKKISGTLAGKVYIEATSNGITWDRIDSLVMVDQATNKKHKEFTGTGGYNSFRSYYETTGTQSCALWITLIRRPDE